MDQLTHEGQRARVAGGMNTRLSGVWLTIARVTWLTLVIPCLVFFIASLPLYYQQLQVVCADPRMCNPILQSFSSIELSRNVYAALNTLITFIFAVIWCAIGFLLFWRRSDDWLALLAAFVLVTYQTASPSTSIFTLTYTFPALSIPLDVIGFLNEVAIGAFFLLFPHGRLIPRWMGMILLLLVLNAFLSAANLEASWPDWLNLLVNFVLYGSVVFSQIYRYRRVSTPVQRQQTKWVIFGFTVVIATVISLLVIAALIPSLTDTPFWNGVWSLVLPTALLFIPLTIGFSILRYRLYDIDILINRTLVYGSLTLILALIYAGLVLGGQALLSSLLNANNTLVIILSTLVVAALFQPLRSRIQGIIDRRFYRQKYDAARTLQAFSAALHQEVEIEHLCEHILSAVQETMQPAHLSLWLRPRTEEHNHKE